MGDKFWRNILVRELSFTPKKKNVSSRVARKAIKVSSLVRFECSYFLSRTMSYYYYYWQLCQRLPRDKCVQISYSYNDMKINIQLKIRNENKSLHYSFFSNATQPQFFVGQNNTEHIYMYTYFYITQHNYYITSFFFFWVCF